LIRSQNITDSASRSRDAAFDQDSEEVFNNVSAAALALSVMFCDLINLYYSRW
jgi:hypothetical protein